MELDSCFSLLAYALKFLRLLEACEVSRIKFQKSIARFEILICLIPKAAANEGELALA